MVVFCTPDRASPERWSQGKGARRQGSKKSSAGQARKAVSANRRGQVAKGNKCDSRNGASPTESPVRDDAQASSTTSSSSSSSLSSVWLVWADTVQSGSESVMTSGLGTGVLRGMLLAGLLRLVGFGGFLLLECLRDESRGLRNTEPQGTEGVTSCHAGRSPSS